MDSGVSFQSSILVKYHWPNNRMSWMSDTHAVRNLQYWVITAYMLRPSYIRRPSRNKQLVKLLPLYAFKSFLKGDLDYNECLDLYVVIKNAPWLFFIISHKSFQTEKNKTNIPMTDDKSKSKDWDSQEWSESPGCVVISPTVVSIVKSRALCYKCLSYNLATSMQIEHRWKSYKMKYLYP